MRYFIEAAYNGTKYSGWQIQPNAMTVQQILQEQLSYILRDDIEIVGCGRTDAGVHASQYFFHMDTNAEVINHIRKINKSLPSDISIFNIKEVKPEAHARFDATGRAYEYLLSYKKDTFNQDQVFHYDMRDKLDFDKLQEAAHLLLDYATFYPFCKTNHDAFTMDCDLRRCEWEDKGNQLVFHIEANRFLRGMVRLIVGMCIHVANNNISLDEVRYAMENQTRLTKNLSVPASGLYLSKISYDWDKIDLIV